MLPQRDNRGLVETTASERLEAGWEDLAAGRWNAARAAFSSALAEKRAPAAYEGLSWAAWWLDEADATIDARRSAYHLYRRRGDAAAAARMATWLACDELDFHGAMPVASGWLGRARRLLEPLEAGPDHGWLSFFEGYIAHIRSDSTEAVARARQAARLGREFQVADLEVLGLALEGAALVACAEVEQGMRCLDEATVAALEGEATVPISDAWACCFLVTACTAVLDFDRAFEWCDRIAEFAERYGSRYMLAFCRAEYGAVHIWRGRWDEAESVLESSIADFNRSRPAMVGGPVAELAELRRRQGRTSEATRLLEDAPGSGAAQLCRARLALDSGDTRRAAELAERRLRQLPEQRRLQRAPALELLVRAQIASGDLDAAASTLRVFREIEQRVGTVPLRASADLGEGMLAAARGDHEGARPRLEDAVDGFERSRAPFEAAGARIELSTSLMALGRAASARREADAAHRAFAELGAELEARRAQRLLVMAEGEERGTPLAVLTPREHEVLALVAEGLTNPLIAERLVVSEHTVHRHVTNILRKLDVPSRSAAAAELARSTRDP